MWQPVQPRLPNRVAPLPAFPDVVRLAGKSNGALWFLLGQRTFAYVREGDGPSWQYQTKGRLGHGPAFVEGLVILADETGLVTAVDATQGTALWRRQLASPPAQAPFAGGSGVVVTTLGGEVVVLAPKTGDLRLLKAPSQDGPALAAPYGEGVLVLGGAAPGLVWFPPNRDPVTLGDAKPLAAAAPFEAPNGIAWVEADGGVRWLSRAPGAKPLALPAAGATEFRPVVADGTCYVVGRDRVLRAVRLDRPDAVAWQVALPGAPQSGPVLVGEGLVVRLETALVAYER